MRQEEDRGGAGGGAGGGERADAQAGAESSLLKIGLWL